MLSDDELLFEPGREALDTGGPVDAPAPRVFDADDAGGFSVAEYRFWKQEDPTGKPFASRTVTRLREPLIENGPLVWWHVRDYYYDLPWSDDADDLSRWLRKRANVERMQTGLDEFGIDRGVDFRPSRRMLHESRPDATYKEVHVEHHTETVGSTCWIIAFLLCMQNSSKACIRDKAFDLAKAMASLAFGSIDACERVPEGLPPCGRVVVDGAQGGCVHCHRLIVHLRSLFGDSWRGNPLAACTMIFIGTKSTYDCPRVRQWRRDMFGDFAFAVDLGADRLPHDATGLAVLRGQVRRRRMVSLWRALPSMSVKMNEHRVEVFSDRQERCGDALQREGITLGRYHAWLSSTLTGASHVSLAVDCVDAGCDLATVCCWCVES
jgi:hypothetical protein